MKIDLKWGLPFVGPFILGFMGRLFSWAVGVEWVPSPDFVGFCLLFGIVGGFAIALMMDLVEVRWNVRIGRKRDY